MSLKNLSVITVAVLLAATHQTFAAGFYIQEQSVKGLGSAFSGSTTSIDDASTVYFNPAGMTKLDRAQINAGVHVLLPKADLSNDGSSFFGAPITGNDGGNPYSATPIPNIYAVTPITDERVYIGIGVTAPFGLTNDYDDGWFGRYDSTKTELKTINIQPSIAVQSTPWLAVGAGIDIQYADAKLQSNVSNVVSEGVSTLKGDDWSIGYNVGAQITPTDKTTIGIHYRSAIEHTLEGSASVEGLNAGNFDVNASADLNLPDIATLGVAHEVTDDLRLTAQATWYGWSKFAEIRTLNKTGTTLSNIEQGFEDTIAFAVGGEYDVNEKWTVRAGYQYDKTPTIDQFRTSRTPDGDRNWFSTGATYKVNDKIDVDVAATYIKISEEKINVTRNSGLANVRSKTDGSVGIAAAGVNYKF